MGHGTNECLLSREAASLPRRPCGRGHAATIPPAVLPLPISSFDVPPFLPPFSLILTRRQSHVGTWGSKHLASSTRPSVRVRPSARMVVAAEVVPFVMAGRARERKSDLKSLPQFANFVEKSPRKQRVSEFFCRPWSAISLAIPNRNERRTKAQASLCLWRERREER